MKILLNKNERPRQFGTIKVLCSDQKMAEILAAKNRWPKRRVEAILQHIKDMRSGKETFFEFLFHSGAKLKVDVMAGNFYIYSYSSDGMDGVHAAEELKMLSHLRMAVKHYFASRSRFYKSREPDFHDMFD